MREISFVSTRRKLATLLAIVAGTAFAAVAGYSVADNHADSARELVVYKTPWCGCCVKWIEQLEAEGVAVKAIDVESTSGAQADAGVPRGMGSCHTGRFGKYWVEGHVPPDLVAELLREQPDDIVGLSVPGMPRGSAGMEGPNPERYNVYRVMTDGTVEVHAVRDGNARPPS